MANAKVRSVNVRVRRIEARIERLKIELNKLGNDPQPQAAQATAQPEAPKKASWISGLLGIPRQIFGSVSSATRTVVGTVKTSAHKAASFTVKHAGAIKASLSRTNKLMAQAISHASEQVGAFWDKYSVPAIAAFLAVVGVGFAAGGGVVGAIAALFYISLATTIALTWVANAALEQQRAFIVYRPTT